VKNLPAIGCRETHEVDCSPRGLPNSVPNAGCRLCDSESRPEARVKKKELAIGGCLASKSGRVN
jgi:hypothetical protein